MNTRLLLVASALIFMQNNLVHAGRNRGGRGGGGGGGGSRGSRDGDGRDGSGNGGKVECEGVNSPSEIGFFCGEAWEDQTAEEKLDELWDQCQAI